MSAGFAEELIQIARPAPMESHPFLTRVQQGEADRETLRAYTVALMTLAAGFPRTLSSVLASCDEPSIRKSLLGNMLEEEGVVAFEPELGVTMDPLRGHGYLARRLARAAGASEAELDAARAPAPNWFTDTLRAGEWLGPLAYFAVGIEANVPATFTLLIQPFREQYGFADEDMAYLIDHVSADERHGEEMAELIGTVATTPDARRKALDGARRGGLAWWHFHRQFVRSDAA